MQQHKAMWVFGTKAAFHTKSSTATKPDTVVQQAGALLDSHYKACCVTSACVVGSVTQTAGAIKLR